MMQGMDEELKKLKVKCYQKTVSDSLLSYIVQNIKVDKEDNEESVTVDQGSATGDVVDSPKPFILENYYKNVLSDTFQKSKCQRCLWSEMPEVRESGKNKSLTKSQKNLQNAMFEVITSETSYYCSLIILTTHFLESPLFNNDKGIMISETDRHHIFSNILHVTKASHKFLSDLEQRWKEQQPCLKEVCDIILFYAKGDDFESYVTYIWNQKHQNEVITRLKKNNKFRKRLDKLENSKVCCNLPLDSYFVLPMQRLTKLKLCVDAILKIMHSDDVKETIKPKYLKNAENASLELERLLSTSNSVMEIMDNKNILLSTINKLDFNNLKTLTLSDQWLIKHDKFQVHPSSSKTSLKFNKTKLSAISLILFTDVLLVVEENNSGYQVIDYSEVAGVMVTDTTESKEYFSKRISVTSNGSDTSVPRTPTSTSRDDEQDIINKSFLLKFLSGQTPIFNNPIALLARDKAHKDEWIERLTNGSTLL